MTQYLCPTCFSHTFSISFCALSPLLIIDNIVFTNKLSSFLQTFIFPCSFDLIFPLDKFLLSTLLFRNILELKNFMLELVRDSVCLSNLLYLLLFF